ncbi:hypothetical protein [Candidatus Similichlamydia epinepheli]|uniref:hypothetical protein n=1 Tax=Candidatus Similichlamydia epinepheli TaxID=1903953 RepID=UPI000D3833AA|nr:hypothetical protein [Candidatus Similichlamydia epinepheli]
MQVSFLSLKWSFFLLFLPLFSSLDCLESSSLGRGRVSENAFDRLEIPIRESIKEFSRVNETVAQKMTQGTFWKIGPLDAVYLQGKPLKEKVSGSPEKWKEKRGTLKALP